MRNDLWIIIERLGDIVLQYNEGCIVEIGLGQSTFIFSRLATEFNRKHYACDKSDRTCNWLKEKIKNENTIILQQNSLDFLGNFKEDKVALFLIDGNHKDQYVRKETKLLIKKLVPGGIGFLHDTYVAKEYYEKYKARGKTTEPYLTRQWLERQKDFWTLTWEYTANNCGLTLIKKKRENRPFYQQ